MIFINKFFVHLEFFNFKINLNTFVQDKKIYRRLGKVITKPSFLKNLLGFTVILPGLYLIIENQ